MKAAVWRAEDGTWWCEWCPRTEWRAGLWIWSQVPEVRGLHRSDPYRTYAEALSRAIEVTGA